MKLFASYGCIVFGLALFASDLFITMIVLVAINFMCKLKTGLHLTLRRTYGLFVKKCFSPLTRFSFKVCKIYHQHAPLITWFRSEI